VEHGSTSPRSRAFEDDGVGVTVGDLPDGFYVADDGPGIPASKRDTVFDVDYSTSDDGTGFGLRIVEQIAEAHGWTVEVTEGREGGARFEITGVTFDA
jgi:signal transduction histidine kinase